MIELPVPQWFEDLVRAEARDSAEVIRCVRLSRLCGRYYDRFFRTNSRIAHTRAARLMKIRDALYLTLDGIQAQEYLSLVRGKGMN